MYPGCMFCGELERVEVFEAFADGAFILDACCEGMLDAANEEMAEDPKAAARWLGALPVAGFDELGGASFEQVMGRDLRRVLDNDGQLLLDWNLRIVPIAWSGAKAFIKKHHDHCKPPAGWRFGAAVMNGSQMVGVVSVGRPVARAIDHKKVVEVNRLCVRRDVPRGLVWNACSLLYGWAAREAKKRGFERVITYTMEHEPGVTLRAVGWKPEACVRGRVAGWDTASRPRDAANTPNVNKVRWARELRAA